MEVTAPTSWKHLLHVIVDALLMLGNLVAPPIIIWWQECDVFLLRPGLPVQWSRLGIVFVTLHAFLWLLVVLPLAAVHWRTWCSQPATSAPCRSTMEVSSADSSARRRCPVDGIEQEDRTRHCWHGKKACFPVFDHWCPYIVAALYAGSFKPYYLMINALVLYQGLTIALVFFAIGDRRIRREKPFLGGLLVVLLYFPFSVRLVWLVSKHFFWVNATERERRRGGIHTRVWLSPSRTEIVTWRYNTGVASPYDLGVAGNFHLFMGPWWSILFFWMPTPAMTEPPRYGQKFLDHVRAQAEPEEELVWSHGWAETAMGDLPARTDVRQRRQLTSSDGQTSLQATAGDGAVGAET